MLNKENVDEKIIKLIVENAYTLRDTKFNIEDIEIYKMNKEKRILLERSKKEVDNALCTLLRLYTMITGKYFDDIYK